MSHLLWKYYWDNDVERFRRLLAPAGYAAQTASKSPNLGSPAQFAASPAGFPGTSPRVARSRKVSGYAPSAGNTRGAANLVGKAEINSRDHAGLTILMRAASSTAATAIL